MNEAPQRRYEVVGVKIETPQVTTLRILCNGKRPHFIPGQFITVYFPDMQTPEGKAYSLSSTLAEPTLAITVKALGTFSNRLCSMRVGDFFIGSDPYGFFYSEKEKTPLVMLAIGIGVAPFRSLIQHALSKEVERELVLCYGNRTAPEVIFKEEFEEWSDRYPNFCVTHFISREDLPPPVERGRMTAARVLASIKASPDAEFMLCGSIAFVRDMWRGLRELGIREERIYTEAFFTN